MQKLPILCAALIFFAACSGMATCCMAAINSPQPDNQESKLKETQTGKKTLCAPAAKPGEIIVKFKPEVGEKRIREIIAGEGLEVIRIVRPPSLYLLKSRDTNPALVNKRITDLKKYQEIEYAEPNYTAKPARN